MANPAPIRLIVVDDDEGIRTLLEVTVGMDPRFELIGTAASGAETMELLEHPDVANSVHVVLLDVTLPDTDGVELLTRVRACATTARIALFTGWDDAATIERAKAAGADAIFPKDGHPQSLLDSLAQLVH